MSVRHPIVAVTGSSGAGSAVVTSAFERIMRREDARFAVVDGDGFHRYDRAAFQTVVDDAQAAGKHLSHFAPEANLLDRLDALLREYGDKGTGMHRRYIHDALEAEDFGQAAGEFTEWEAIPEDTDLLCYEGLHGCYVSDGVDIAQHMDLKIGVVPIVNLEWIQKIHSDTGMRGYTADAVTDTILRRMPDYVHHITPQFSLTDITFQRIPTVDTSNPFDVHEVPGLDESAVVIRFSDPQRTPTDFPYLMRRIHDAFVSRRNTIVVPGSQLEHAMEVILLPLVHELLEKRRRTQ